jgi:hypothetical protein
VHARAAVERHGSVTSPGWAFFASAARSSGSSRSALPPRTARSDRRPRRRRRTSSTRTAGSRCAEHGQFLLRGRATWQFSPGSCPRAPCEGTRARRGGSSGQGRGRNNEAVPPRTAGRRARLLPAVPGDSKPATSRTCSAGDLRDILPAGGGVWSALATLASRRRDERAGPSSAGESVFSRVSPRCVWRGVRWLRLG